MTVLNNQLVGFLRLTVSPSRGRPRECNYRRWGQSLSIELAGIPELGFHVEILYMPSQESIIPSYNSLN